MTEHPDIDCAIEELEETASLYEYPGSTWHIQTVDFNYYIGAAIQFEDEGGILLRFGHITETGSLDSDCPVENVVKRVERHIEYSRRFLRLVDNVMVRDD